MESSAHEARQIVQELPDGVRILAIFTSSAPAHEPARAAAAVCDFTRAVAWQRGRTVLVDLAAPDGPLATLLGSTGARGLADVLAGTATVREAAVPSDHHGFIYLPPGCEQTRSGPEISDRVPAYPLRRLLEKAHASGATLVLHAGADSDEPEDGWEIVEGSIAVGNAEIPAAAPALIARLLAPVQEAEAKTPEVEPPRLVNQPAEEGGRRVIAAGRWEGATATTGQRRSFGHQRIQTRHRKTSTGKLGVRRPGRRDAAGAVLAVALLSLSLLIVFWVALSSPDTTSGNDGAPRSGAGPVGAPWAPQVPTRDSLPIRLPSTLPFSTLSTGYVPEAGLPDTTEASGPTESERN